MDAEDQLAGIEGLGDIVRAPLNIYAIPRRGQGRVMLHFRAEVENVVAISLTQICFNSGLSFGAALPTVTSTKGTYQTLNEEYGTKGHHGGCSLHASRHLR